MSNDSRQEGKRYNLKKMLPRSAAKDHFWKRNRWPFSVTVSSGFVVFFLARKKKKKKLWPCTSEPFAFGLCAYYFLKHVVISSHARRNSLPNMLDLLSMTVWEKERILQLKTWKAIGRTVTFKPANQISWLFWSSSFSSVLCSSFNEPVLIHPRWHNLQQHCSAKICSVFLLLFPTVT